MLLFVVGLVVLIVGYYTYGRFVERVLAPDDRPTPAQIQADGVDFVILPHWKNMLIQLLNIAGIGPVIGVILGIKFGSIVFLIIPLGNLIGGAVHDFVAGMMSLRAGGANLPRLVEIAMGKHIYRAFAVFMVLLLLLVVAVFINIPAQLIDGLMPSAKIFWLAVGAIFCYYIAATLFPVDKIIGKIYPFFGLVLILSTLALLGVLLWQGAQNPALLQESAAFQAAKLKQPIIPMLFVTIACGILSGFHATQSPIIARTMKTERQARSSFYGMMVLEGIIAMIWAGGALAIYNLFPELLPQSPTVALQKLTTYFLGSWMGIFTVLGVIVLAITSGDTAMRSLRLSLAEIFKFDQKPTANRIKLTLPLIVVICGLLWWSNIDARSFAQLWNYFAWGNQVLAASTLLAATVWMGSMRKPVWITLVPGMFMTFVVLTYILWISPTNLKGAPLGFGLPLNVAYAIAAALAMGLGYYAMRRGQRAQHDLLGEPLQTAPEAAK